VKSLIKLIFTGDWHIRGTNPRNRLGDYRADIKDKLREVFQLAKNTEAAAIVVPGDIFDRPEVSIAVLLEFAEVLNESEVPILTTPGNHDIYGYNLATYWRSSLRLLEMLVPKLTVFTETTQRHHLKAGTTEVVISFTPYSAKMDINGYGYDPNTDIDPALLTGLSKNTYKIHVAHGMLLDHVPPFDRYTFIQDAYTTADLVLTGHDHTGYGLYKRPDGKLFCNPGSLTRLAASVNEIGRTVRVALIAVNGHESTQQFINLAAAKPGDEVLDRSKIDLDKKRIYAMETFSTLIQSKTGDKVLLDVNQIMEEIAKLEGAAPHIVKAALEIIDQQREKVK
jgi:exonuclease SbcD